MPSFTSVCIIALLAHVGAAAPSKLADTLDSVRELATHNKSVAHAARRSLHSLALHERARARARARRARAAGAARAREGRARAHARERSGPSRARIRRRTRSTRARVAGMQAAVARNEQRVARQYAALGGERAARRLQESVPRDGDAAARARAARERRRAGRRRPASTPTVTRPLARSTASSTRSSRARRPPRRSACRPSSTRRDASPTAGTTSRFSRRATAGGSRPRACSAPRAALPSRSSARARARAWLDALEAEFPDDGGDDNQTINQLPALGFGVSRDDGACKLYVMGVEGAPLPRLPLVPGVVDDVAVALPPLSANATKRNAQQMLSLEWALGSDEVALRRYAVEAERDAGDRRALRRGGRRGRPPRARRRARRARARPRRRHRGRGRERAVRA